MKSLTLNTKNWGNLPVSRRFARYILLLIVTIFWNFRLRKVSINCQKIKLFQIRMGTFFARSVIPISTSGWCADYAYHITIAPLPPASDFQTLLPPCNVYVGPTCILPTSIPLHCALFTSFILKSQEIFMMLCITWGNIHVLRNHKREWVRKWQLRSVLNVIRNERGVRNPLKHDYVLCRWSQ